MKYSKSNAVKIIGAGIVLGIIVSAVNVTRREINDYEITRPDYEESATEYQIEISDGSKTIEIPMTISPKKYSEAEAFEHLKKIKEVLPEIIIGNNQSLNDVRGNLNLVSSIEGEPVDIQWYSGDYSLIDYDGTVNNYSLSDSEKISCQLQAQLQYLDYTDELYVDVIVASPVLSEEEAYKKAVESALLKADKTQEGEDAIHLPSTINGVDVKYARREEANSTTIFPLAAIVVAILLKIKSKLDFKKDDNERKQQLRFDYSEMISKLNILVCAGMTFRNAWEKIVIDYGKNTNKKKRHYVYEEMSETLYQMKAGISELSAYEQFGKRCGTKEYMKMSSLLQQNLKKGSKGLVKLLEQEAKDAMEQRKNLAVQKGEEAGTKLLFPMIIMLIVVMIIVMVPALMSFQV